MNADAKLTVAAVRARGWECVRLGRRAKKPDGGPRWQTTKDAGEIAEWFDLGYNVGLVCHERTGVAVLDPDHLLAWASMIDVIGQPCLPWVITGSGRFHYYVKWVPDLPAKLTWENEVVGEIQRGPGLQQVVMPGSTHPDGGVYTWITKDLSILCEPIDPVTDPLPELPGDWLVHLRHDVYFQRYLREQRRRYGH